MWVIRVNDTEKLETVRYILGPHIDLLQIGEKYGTYKILVSYGEVKQLREALKRE